jgi:hypothetical protein
VLTSRQFPLLSITCPDQPYDQMASKGVVELTIDPAARAYVMGVPITLRTLYVSVNDPEALIEECAPK